jgi:hypothetical protein
LYFCGDALAVTADEVRLCAACKAVLHIVCC